MEEEMIQALKEMDKKRVEELNPNTRKLFDTIMHVCDERDKYKSLYENGNKLIDTILESDIFMNECPLSFDYVDNSIYNKAKNIFYENAGEYCENNCNDCYKKCWLKYFEEIKRLKEIK